MSRRPPRWAVILTWACRLLLGGLFLFAAFGKILHPAEFASAIRKFHVLPYDWTNLPAIVLPWVEAVAGLSLVFGPWRRGASLWLGLLLVGFLGLFGWVLAKGLDVDCGCFGSLGVYLSVLAGDVGLKSILRNVVLLLMAIWSWRWEVRHASR